MIHENLLHATCCQVLRINHLRLLKKVSQFSNILRILGNLLQSRICLLPLILILLRISAIKNIAQRLEVLKLLLLCLMVECKALKLIFGSLKILLSLLV